MQGTLSINPSLSFMPIIAIFDSKQVPFLDVSNTMLDPSLPLTIMDYDEFGDPNVQEEFEIIHSYSPYDNIVPGVCYPSTLVTASFHDSRFALFLSFQFYAL